MVRSFAVRHFHDHMIAPHAHDWHQLIYASEGVMWVHTAQGDWVVPPNRAVWVPAGVEHGIEMTGKVLVQTIYLAAGISGDLPAEMLCGQCFATLTGIDHSHREAGNAGREHSFASALDRLLDGSTERAAGHSAPASVADGRPREACGGMVAGTPR